jgi:hypothetical protein
VAAETGGLDAWGRALNVFGPNVVARSLYKSMGYNAMAIEMGKDLF